MTRFLADENFNGKIIRGLLKKRPLLDLLRVQDVDLGSAKDSSILEWAAREGRVLLTHDVETIPCLAYDRVQDGLSMPGVIEVFRDMRISEAVLEISIIAECSLEGEWEGQVIYLPLR